MKKLKIICNNALSALKRRLTQTLASRSEEKATHQDLIKIDTIDVTNFKNVDDILDYVNKVGKERFTNESIEKLTDRIKTIKWFTTNYPDIKDRHEELYKYCLKQSYTDYDYFMNYKIDYMNYIDECCVKINGYSIINGNCCNLDGRTNIRQLLN